MGVFLCILLFSTEPVPLSPGMPVQVVQRFPRCLHQGCFLECTLLKKGEKVDFSFILAHLVGLFLFKQATDFVNSTSLTLSQ